MRLMGDRYVKEEFRLHRDVPSQQALIFLKQWTDYCTELSRQLSNKGIKKGEVGNDLNTALLHQFTDEQIVQLYELKVESEKWREKKQALSQAT
ncbi:Protein F25H9.7 a [Aphelenchoides avenae]|nr:Protein F25H9.7 a [Aphelenchus avenae]